MPPKDELRDLPICSWKGITVSVLSFMEKKYSKTCTSQWTLGDNAASKHCIKEIAFWLYYFSLALSRLTAFTGPNQQIFLLVFHVPSLRAQPKCQRAEETIYWYATSFSDS